MSPRYEPQISVLTDPASIEQARTLAMGKAKELVQDIEYYSPSEEGMKVNLLAEYVIPMVLEILEGGDARPLKQRIGAAICLLSREHPAGIRCLPGLLAQANDEEIEVALYRICGLLSSDTTEELRAQCLSLLGPPANLYGRIHGSRPVDSITMSLLEYLPAESFNWDMKKDLIELTTGRREYLRDTAMVLCARLQLAGCEEALINDYRAQECPPPGETPSRISRFGWHLEESGLEEKVLNIIEQRLSTSNDIQEKRRLCDRLRRMLRWNAEKDRFERALNLLQQYSEDFTALWRPVCQFLDSSGSETASPAAMACMKAYLNTVLRTGDYPDSQVLNAIAKFEGPGFLGVLKALAHNREKIAWTIWAIGIAARGTGDKQLVDWLADQAVSTFREENPQWKDSQDPHEASPAIARARPIHMCYLDAIFSIGGEHAWETAKALCEKFPINVSRGAIWKWRRLSPTSAARRLWELGLLKREPESDSLRWYEDRCVFGDALHGLLQQYARYMPFDQESGLPDPPHDNLIGELAALSEGVFIPVACCQFVDDEIDPSWKIDRSDSDRGTSLSVVQFICGERLYRATLHPSGDYYDEMPVLDAVNAAMRDKGSDMRFFWLEGGILFGERTALKQAMDEMYPWDSTSDLLNPRWSHGGLDLD